MMRALMRNSRRVIVVAAIVAVNFAVVLQLTGLSYGRYMWTAFSVSYGTPTPTATPTATPTNTPVPNGGVCMTSPQCASTFCVDGVCCDRACDQPGEFCNLAGRLGICTVPTAGAPVLDSRWLVGALLLLVAVGAFALRRRPTS